MNRSGALATMALFVALSSRAAAATPASIDEAKRLFAEAHRHVLAGHCAEAMPLLARSHELVPSPNSGLLLARCLAETGHRVEAAEKYGEVEKTALAAVRAGESRYAETATTASREGEVLRGQLGRLRLHRPASAAVKVEIDGRPVSTTGEGDVVVLHEPGTAHVTIVAGELRHELVVAVEAGREATVGDASPNAPRTSAPRLATEALPPAHTSAGIQVGWHAYATGGLAVAGLGSFAGFGFASESAYTDLKGRCAPHCTPADRADADRGAAFQTAANVGLVVGVGAAVVTTLLVLLER